MFDLLLESRLRFPRWLRKVSSTAPCPPSGPASPIFFIVCDKRTCVVFQSMGYNCGHLQYLAVTLQHAIEQHRPIVVSWSMALPFSLWGVFQPGGPQFKHRRRLTLTGAVRSLPSFIVTTCYNSLHHRRMRRSSFWKIVKLWEYYGHGMIDMT